MCADCGSPAAWVFDNKGALPIEYCDRCLPTYLRSRAKSGSLTKAASSDPPVLQPEQVEVEAPPAWEPEAPTPAPKRRTRKASVA